MGLFKGIKHIIDGGCSITPSAPAAPPGKLPTEKSIYQSRQNFGLNFGSLFVLEKYIFNEMFIDGANSELEAIKNNVKKNGINETRKELEHHWLEYCTDDDWVWLKQIGIQSVRIPIGYWMVGGGRFNKGTSFEAVSEVYQNAWVILKRYYIEKAKKQQISVLVDLHALPKGANTGDHSGELFENAGFWDSDDAIDLAVSVCSFIAKDLEDYDNVCGIQIVNESVFDNNPSGQEKYYTKAINAIRKVDPGVPVVISDGWWADQWVQFLDKVSKGNIGSLGVVIDDHVYRCFSEEDKKKSVEQVITELDSSVLTGLSKEADFIVGEYSCVLDGKTWDNSQGCNREEKVKEFGNKQLDIFKSRAKSGYYFWTYKFQHGDGGEWGLWPMVDGGGLPSRDLGCSLPSQEDYHRILNESYENHMNYWKSQNENEKYEFWRYEEGFKTGWNDAAAFATFDNSRLGRIVAWKYSRRNEHINARGASAFVWEWDAGFQEGVDKLNTCVDS